MKMSKLRILIVLVATILLSVAAFGQTTTAEAQFKIKLQALVDTIKKATTPQDKKNEFDFNTNPDTFALALALKNKSPQIFVIKAEEARLDKQVGGGDENSGSTSLTSKGSVPSILGFAVENGALAREISGTTITFRGNPVGIIKALGEAGFTGSYHTDDASTRFLRKFSFALSFDANRDQNGQINSMPIFTGSQQQLSSYSIRYDIWNKRDPRNKAYQAEWTNLIRGDLSEMNSALARVGELLDEELKENKKLNDWFQDASQAVSSASDSEINTVLEREFGRLIAIPLSKQLNERLEIFIKQFTSYLEGRDKILEAVAKGAIFTLEYTNKRDVNMPDLSNIKLIAETGIFHGKADLTGNLSVTLFNKKPTTSNDERLRDIQLSGQLDVPLANPLKNGNFILSFSGKFQRIREDMMMANGMMTDSKGTIGTGQIKLTIPVKGSGVKIPISFTVANRTELIKEKLVKGNIGITFDIDSLFSRTNP